MIFAAPLTLSFSVFKIVSADTDTAALIGILPPHLGAGIWMAGFNATIKFNSDSMSVTWGHIPFFLWWLRKKGYLQGFGNDCRRYLPSHIYRNV